MWIRSHKTISISFLYICKLNNIHEIIWSFVYKSINQSFFNFCWICLFLLTFTTHFNLKTINFTIFVFLNLFTSACHYKVNIYIQFIKTRKCQFILFPLELFSNQCFSWLVQIILIQQIVQISLSIKLWLNTYKCMKYLIL